MSASTLRTSSLILSRLVSLIIYKSSSIASSILSALCFIWLSDSSPDAYKTLRPFLQASFAICKRSVLLPAPGFAVSMVTESLTMPSPITLLNSSKLVLSLSEFDEVTVFNCIALLFMLFSFFTAFFVSSMTSFRLPQEPHSGHLPK